MFLHALSVPVQRSTLHQGVRQFLHRMVVCLDVDILPFIPVAMQSLLEHADVREQYDFIPFVNQVVQKFKVLIRTLVETSDFSLHTMPLLLILLYSVVYLLLTNSTSR